MARNVRARSHTVGDYQHSRIDQIINDINVHHHNGCTGDACNIRNQGTLGKAPPFDIVPAKEFRPFPSMKVRGARKDLKDVLSCLEEFQDSFPVDAFEEHRAVYVKYKRELAEVKDLCKRWGFFSPKAWQKANELEGNIRKLRKGIQVTSDNVREEALNRNKSSEDNYDDYDESLESVPATPTEHGSGGQQHPLPDASQPPDCCQCYPEYCDGLTASPAPTTR